MKTFAVLIIAVGLLQAPSDPLPAPVIRGVSRFQQVDEKLYRGGQPDAEGLRQLRTLGIDTIVNLRAEQDAFTKQERALVESLGMRYLSLPVAGGNFFTRSRVVPDEVVRQFFAAVDDARGPIFVHCQRGADRTGTIVALYRIARHGWNNERAYSEARELGMRSWYAGFKNQILAFRPPPGIVDGEKRW